MKYTNPPKPIPELLELLRSDGVIIHDEHTALRYLTHVGYFRLIKYMLLLKRGAETSFDDILNLYRFDTYLRMILFEAVTIIEISAKSVINTVMCNHGGAHWYLETDNFKKKFTDPREITLPNPDPNGEKLFRTIFSYHDEFLLSLERVCDNQEEPFIKSYSNKYKEPKLPPSWMMMDVISFGQISILFKNILPSQQRTQIAGTFNSHDNIFTSWLHCISAVRNYCAHNQNLVGRSIRVEPIMPSRKKNIFLNNPEVNVRKLYAALCCIQYLLNAIEEPPDFKRNLLSGIDHYEIDLSLLGFTPNWRDEPIWQL